MAKVFISTPCSAGLIHQKTVITTQQLSMNHLMHYFYIENCSLITKGRQDHFGMFLQKDYDYMLTIDADMVVGPPGILDRMIDRMPNNNCIMGGMYAMKALNEHGVPPVNGKPLNNASVILDGRLIPMEYLPTGFMLVPRQVALKIAEHFSDLEYQDHVIGKTWAVYNTLLKKDEKGVQRFLPEDFSFCERARTAGIELYADTSLMLGHIGYFLYHIEHLRRS